MSVPSNPKITARKENTINLIDLDGNPILEIGQQEYTVRHSDGSITHRNISQNIQTVCGLSWNPQMLYGKPPVHIGICQACRSQTSPFHKKTHGIVTIHRAKTCQDCGQLCCPKHRKHGRDKKWRCLKHHKIHLLKTFLRPIFFEKRER